MTSSFKDNFPSLNSFTGKESQIQTQKGLVRVSYLSNSAPFGGLVLEHQEKGPANATALWLLTFMAFIKNNALYLWAKALKPQKSKKEILWSLGRDPRHFSSILYDRFCPVNHEVKTRAASWRALDIFYNYHEKIKPGLNGKMNGLLARWFMGDLHNRQSVTNRYKLVQRVLTDAITHYSNGGGDRVRIVSIASGSAQALIEAFKGFPPNDAKAVLIDLDETALDEAKRLATIAGLGDRFSYVKGGPAKLGGFVAEFKPQIIEIIGFLDYRPKEKAISLIKRIYESLPEGGLFLTCNIRKNTEKPFLDWAVLWPMIYRNENQLADILIEGGFSPENIRLIYEPFRIHGIAVCRK